MLNLLKFYELFSIENLAVIENVYVAPPPAPLLPELPPVIERK